MREGGSRRIPILGGLVLLLLSGIAAQAQDVVVRQIEIQGLQRYDRALILSRLQTKEGGVFNRDTLQKDIQRLYASGFFSDIQFTEELVEGGLKLSLIVEESQIIQAFELEGNKEFDDTDLLKEFRLRVGDLFSRYLLSVDMESIKKKYKEKGYNFVDVSEVVKPVPGGVQIQLAIREGPRVTVELIDTTGNVSFEDHELIDVMKTQENAWYASHPFQEENLQDDVERVKAFYRSEGFLDAQAAVEDVRYNVDKTEVTVVIHVDEGIRYQIKEVRLEGNTLFTTDQCVGTMQMKPGDFFVGRKVDGDQRSVKELYGEQGYVDTTIDVKPQLTEEPGQLKLVYKVTEGGQYYLGRMDFVGNTKTMDKVARRNMPLFPGEIFNLKKMRRGIERLQNSQYFEEVLYRIEDSDDPKLKNLVVELKEGSTGSIRFGGGYSSNFGFLGLVELQQRNFDITDLPHSLTDVIDGTAFAGAGQTLKITVQPGQNRSRYAIDFKEPYFLDWPVGLGVGFFHYQTSRSKYNEERTGGYTGLDYRFADENSPLYGVVIGMNLRAESIKVTDVSDFAPPQVIAVAGESLLQTIGPSIQYDTKDSPIFPTSGYKLYLGLENAGLIGGDYQYNKLVFDADYLMTVYTTDTQGKHVLAFRTTLGWAQPWGDDDETPIFERFYAGGSGTIRGLSFRTVSPKEGGYAVGGDALATFGAEYTFPIYRTELQDRKTDIIRGALFIDTGDVEKEWGLLGWETWRVTAGFGLRFTIPQLGQVPIALDFGFPLKKEEDDDEQVFHLNLGYYY